MTDAQIQQAIKLKEQRDKAFSLANEVHNYGIYRLDKESLSHIFNRLSAEDNRAIRDILTNTMNVAGQEYANALKKL